ncbi:YbaK/EbsC family protein [Streptomyces sp. NRRL S-337]|uniref:YbaK/EbsC family protein n=1 Tax=Streptomyces sp. NRRL S-337 TaxID=1463900 RepID=UPI0004C59CB1|nr:YbaK/EbsC family protein [Streptomyces sp. NRRL S-337]
MSLSKRARQYQEWLHQHGLDLTVVELPESTHTADDAARALRCEKAQIVKSLVFHAVATEEPVLVLASGPNRVNEKAVAAALGSDITKADADFVKTKTGYTIGGVPPLGHKEELALFVDEDLLQFGETWAAAGTPRAVFKIPMKITDILPPHTVISVK